MKVVLSSVISLTAGVCIGYFAAQAGGDDGTGATVPEVNGDAGTGELRDGGSSASRVAALRVTEALAGSIQDDVMIEAAEPEGVVMVPSSLIEELSKSKGSSKLGQELFDRDGQVEEILTITDQEKAVVQTEWRSMRDRVRQLEAQSSSSEDLEDGTVKITVPSLVGQMGAMGEEFGVSVKRTLGENRGEVFLALKQVDQVFTPEDGERTYGVKVESTGNGSWRYHMTLEGASGRRVWVSDKVPDEIRHLTDAARIFPEIENTAVEEDCG